eukprot:3224755-Prymnesium_polylepis.1
MADAIAALDDAEAGCCSWRTLAVPSSPLEELFPRLKPGMRVLQLSLGGSADSALAVGIASHKEPADNLPKGAPEPEAELRVRVARAACPAERVRTLVAAAEAMRAAQYKGALARTKADLYDSAAASAAGGGAPPAAKPDAEEIEAAGGGEKTIRCAIAPADGLQEEESMLRSLVEQMEATFAPLLEQLADFVGPEPPAGGESLQIFLVLDPALALLPFELLDVLRKPHIAAVARDLSAAVLATRLGQESPTAKKGSFGVVVDPRNEVSLPPPSATDGGAED